MDMRSEDFSHARGSAGVNFRQDIDEMISMMWRADDEMFLTIVIGIVVGGTACLMASCNLSVDILPNVPKKPITPLFEDLLQLDMPTFIQAHFGPGQWLFIF